MGSYKETRDHFFDTRDENNSSVSSITSSSNNNEDFMCPEIGDSNQEYEFWTKKPDSVCERRTKFLSFMSLSSNLLTEDTDEEFNSCHEEDGPERNLEKDESFFEISNLEPELISSSSIQSSCSYKTASSTKNGYNEEEEEEAAQIWKIKSLDDGAEFVIEDYADDGTPKSLHEVGSDKIISIDEFITTLGSSRLVQQLLRKDSNNQVKAFDAKNNSNSWLHRFIRRTHSEEKGKDFLVKPYDIDLNKGSGIQKVRVHVYKKDVKELSSIFTGQEFAAHEGSILAMKFSPDGRYLASAGDDGVVRIWMVLEDDVDKLKIQESNPSCLYFSLDQFSKLTLLDDLREETGELKSLKNKKSCTNSTCCGVLPPKTFRLSEKPLHELEGHEGKVLALSWSKNGHLLSSSVDNTARLWRLENDQCGAVYSHNSYVTCIEFNPVDDNQFISGSVDGKLRIWDVQRGRVIDWTDIREIVTALCYCPNGKRGIVGSMDGNCHYYDFIDNCLLLGDQICLNEKKKTGKPSSKRITGFQYCPTDSSKVAVTSADSKVRILSGTSVICKLKGNSNSKTQAPACFTSDGQHIVLTTEDSHVRVWNHSNLDRTNSPRPKTLIRSSESFLSRNASIAIPWCGLKNKLVGSLHGAILGHHSCENVTTMQKWPDRFTASLGIFLDTLHRAGSVTWPEEKLGKKNLFSGKPEFKFLRNAWLNAVGSPHSWGLVIVTAGWDGCIRTFLNYGLPVRF